MALIAFALFNYMFKQTQSSSESRVGSLVGHLALQAFGQYDLPIPRPPSHEILVVPATIDRFAEEWSLPVDELRLWVVLQEIAGMI